MTVALPAAWQMGWGRIDAKWRCGNVMYLPIALLPASVLFHVAKLWIIKTFPNHLRHLSTMCWYDGPGWLQHTSSLRHWRWFWFRVLLVFWSLLCHFRGSVLISHSGFSLGQGQNFIGAGAAAPICMWTLLLVVSAEIACVCLLSK